MKKLALAILCGILLVAESLDAATVVSESPTNGTFVVSLFSSVTLVFSTGMATNTVKLNVVDDSVSPSVVLKGTLTWTPDWTTLAFQPTGGLPPNSMIYWVVNGKDTNGAALSGDNVGGVFFTGSGGGDTPAVAQTLPTNGAANVGLSDPLIIGYSEAMDTNATTVKVVLQASQISAIPLTTSWSADQTVMTNTPAGQWPTQSLMEWTVSGSSVQGGALPNTTGYFTTAASQGGGSGPAVIVVSVGTITEESTSGDIEDINPDAIALSTAGNTLVTTPDSVTNAVSSDGAVLLEWSETETNSAAGAYLVQIGTATNVESATITVNAPAGTQTASLNVAGAESYAVAGLGVPLSWTGDSRWDYVLVRILQNGQIVFESPGPEQTGALTGASNSLNVPPEVVTNTGYGTVQITGFKFHSIETNTIAGVELISAEHTRLERDFQVVPAGTMAPAILSTNINFVPTGEPVIMILWATNGVGPFTWQLVGGSLPAGLTIDPMGAITGTATSVQTNSITLSVTDLLGRTTTSAATVTTVPIETGANQPVLTLPSLLGSGGMSFNLSGSAGSNYELLSSSDLIKWAVRCSTNLPSPNVALAFEDVGPMWFYQARTFDPLRRNAPAKLTLVPDQSGAAALIDQTGGILMLTNGAGYVFTLTIPLGALQSPETITMTNLSQVQGLALDGGLGAAVALGPEGVMFSQPAQLDVTYPTTVPAGTIAFGTSGDGQNYGWHLNSMTNNTVTQYLWHFSSAGTGAASSANAASAGQTSPNDLPSSLDNQLAVALQQALQGQQSDAAVGTLIQAGLQDVIPLCQAAVSDDSQIEAAIYFYVTWARAATLLFPDIGGVDYYGLHPLTIPEQKLAGLIARGQSLIIQAAIQGMQRAYKDCVAHNLKKDLRILDMGRILALFAGSGGDTPDYGSQAFSYIRKCMKFTVEIDSTVTIGARVTAHTRAKVKLRPFSSGPGSDDILMIGRGLWQGRATWIMDEVIPPPPNTTSSGCIVVASPKSGQVNLDLVKMSLYQKVITPSVKGPWTVDYVPNPNLTLYWDAALALKPFENRQVICPGSTEQLDDYFAAAFDDAHGSERIQNHQTDFLPGEIYYVMSGFDFGGDGNSLVFQKTYNDTITGGVEITSIKVYHTP